MPHEAIAYFVRNIRDTSRWKPSDPKVLRSKWFKNENLAAIVVSAFIVLMFFLLTPIPQPQSYHNFADKRHFLGIPYFFNVISNIGFLLAGYQGIKNLSSSNLPTKLMYQIFFAFVFLGGIGSIYYHMIPNNMSLLWDRLPMIIAIMALVSAIVAERVSLNFGFLVLWPLTILASISVIYWEYTEMKGRGDVRSYAFAQLAPVVLIPFILWKLPSARAGDVHLWRMITFVGIARLLEVLDSVIFVLTYHVVSGHTAKQLFLCLAVYEVIKHLKSQNAEKADQNKKVD